MIHRVIDLCFELLARIWHLGLAFCAIAFIIVLLLILRRNREKSSVVKNSSRPRSRPGNPTLSSLRCLPEKYHWLSELYIPRLEDDGTTKIHHVVLSPYSIFVLHVQRESGKIHWQAKSRDWFARQQDTKRSFTNPILRNQYHIKALAKYLEAPEALFHSYVIFESEVKFETKPPPEVLTEGVGRAILSHSSEIISHAMLEKMTHMLRETCTESERLFRRADHSKARQRRLKYNEERAA